MHNSRFPSRKPHGTLQRKPPKHWTPKPISQNFDRGKIASRRRRNFYEHDTHRHLTVRIRLSATLYLSQLRLRIIQLIVDLWVDVNLFSWSALAMIVLTENQQTQNGRRRRRNDETQFERSSSNLRCSFCCSAMWWDQWQLQNLLTLNIPRERSRLTHVPWLKQPTKTVKEVKSRLLLMKLLIASQIKPQTQLKIHMKLTRVAFSFSPFAIAQNCHSIPFIDTLPWRVMSTRGSCSISRSFLCAARQYRFESLFVRFFVSLCLAQTSFTSKSAVRFEVKRQIDWHYIGIFSFYREGQGKVILRWEEEKRRGNSTR